jgi:hypothetical protein
MVLTGFMPNSFLIRLVTGQRRHAEMGCRHGDEDARQVVRAVDA